MDDSVQTIELGIDGVRASVHELTGLAFLAVPDGEWIDAGHVEAMGMHGYVLSDMQPEDVLTGGTAFRFTSAARHAEEATMTDDEFRSQAEQYREAERALMLAVL